MTRPRSVAMMTAVIAIAVGLVLGEIFVRIASPTASLYPRYQFSAQYGMIPFADVVMEHQLPRKYEYHYTINSMQFRGEAIEPGASGMPAIVVLGDSYTFGLGVADGEDYPSVMQRRLRGRAEVVNLGSPGWSLSQEIRRYFALGESYDPRIVVLQFCANDPTENLAYRVTRVENGEFVFVDAATSLNVFKKFLSRSPIQKSQLYNFARTRVSSSAYRYILAREESRLDDGTTAGAGPAVEAAYVELIELFASRLHAQHRELWFISVDHELDEFPHIARTIHEAELRGHLRYLEVVDWLRGREPYDTPEGHRWGSIAHAVIGEHLAESVEIALADSAQ